MIYHPLLTIQHYCHFQDPIIRLCSLWMCTDLLSRDEKDKFWGQINPHADFISFSNLFEKNKCYINIETKSQHDMVKDHIGWFSFKFKYTKRCFLYKLRPMLYLDNEEITQE